MKTILLPIDSSENSQRALEKAKELAGCLGSKIILLNIVSINAAFSYHHYNMSIPAESAAIDWQSIIDQAKEESNELLERSKTKLEGLDVETVTLEVPGEGLGRIIVDYAQKRNVDLIIMGSNGVGSLRQRLYMGSVTTKVLHTTDKPVLVIQ